MTFYINVGGFVFVFRDGCEFGFGENGFDVAYTRKRFWVGRWSFRTAVIVFGLTLFSLFFYYFFFFRVKGS